MITNAVNVYANPGRAFPPQPRSRPFAESESGIASKLDSVNRPHRVGGAPLVGMRAARAYQSVMTSDLTTTELVARIDEIA